MNDEKNIFIHLKTLYGQQNSQGWPYSVPIDYFSSFTQKLQDRISDEEMLPATLLNIANKTPYSVPAGYFGKTDADFSILKRISNEKPYSVPAGYFDGFYEKISLKLPKQTTAPAKHIQRRWWQIAAAAILIGVILIATILFLNDSNSKKQSLKATNFAQQKIEKIATDQLIGFLEVGDSSLVAEKSKSAEKSSKIPVDYNQLFKKISDKDLRKFLDETATDEDDFLLN